MATDARRVYPHAVRLVFSPTLSVKSAADKMCEQVSLMETVRTFSQTVDKVNQNPVIAPLVAEYRNDAHNQITKGLSALILVQMRMSLKDRRKRVQG